MLFSNSWHGHTFSSLQCNQCKVEYHCGFDLHAPYHEECSFSSCSLPTRVSSFCKMPIHAFCPFSYWIVGGGFSYLISATAAKSLQSCPTLCNPIESNPSGSSIPGILQERTLEWVAISFSNAWKWKMKGKSLSRVRLLATPWTAAYQAPASMGSSRQEYWSGVPLPSPHNF